MNFKSCDSIDKSCGFDDQQGDFVKSILKHFNQNLSIPR